MSERAERTSNHPSFLVNARSFLVGELEKRRNLRLEAKYRRLVVTSLNNGRHETYDGIEEEIIKKETGVEFDDILFGKVKRSGRLNKKLDEVFEFTRKAFDRLSADGVVIPENGDRRSSHTYFMLNEEKILP